MLRRINKVHENKKHSEKETTQVKMLLNENVSPNRQ